MPLPPHKIVEVAVPVPLHRTFHYSVPPELEPQAEVGRRVLVPFGKRTLTGYIVDLPVSSETDVREVLAFLDPEPLLTKADVAFLRWSAEYYLHPLGEVLKAALPCGINLESRCLSTTDEAGRPVKTSVMTGGRSVRTETVYRPLSAELPVSLRGRRLRVMERLLAAGEVPAAVLREQCRADAGVLQDLVARGLAAVERREVYRDPFRDEDFGCDHPLPLNRHQATALTLIAGAIDEGRFAPFLLHGVTGSGKTEVYLQAIAHARQQGKSALVLVPEIALTPQLVKRFRRRFGSGIAVLHSALSDGERYDEWRRIRRKEATIVIGARSAIFAPLTRIGVIVVDEEHESSFKQSDGFRYNARDLALVRGKMMHACVVLGSATPLVTTRHAAETGRLTLLPLPERVRELPMPVAEIVDMRRRRGESLSSRLSERMTENLAAQGQTLLFLNRRGFATWLLCRECGEVLRCPNCSVTLTYHQSRRRHFCHYCDYSIPAPSVCTCGSVEIELLGRGTERVEEEVAALFPDGKVARMDRDTTRGRGGHARVLKKVEEGAVDILIGTQMIAKGHDFPGVTLVGVLSADDSLHLPDFRSSERTFQLISQVMGRAGRGDQPGRVVIQTTAPDHYAVARAAEHDFEGFCREELAHRRELSYPPFSHLVGLTFSSTSPAAVEEGAEGAAALLRQLKRELKSRVEVLGPAVAPLGKVRGRFRRQMLLKAPGRNELHRLVARFRERLKLSPMVRLAVDVDPVDML